MEQREGRARPGRWRRRLLLGLAGVAALAVAIRGALPAALGWGIAYAVHRQTGLPAEVGNVDLWLLRGAIAVEGLRVAARPGKMPGAGIDPATALLGWRRLFVDVEWKDLAEERVHLPELVLDGARVRLEALPGGGVDLGFLQGMSGTEEELEAEPASPAEPWPLQLGALVVRDVSVDVVDPAGGAAPVGFTLAQLALRDVSLENGVLSLGVVGIRKPKLRVARAFAEGAVRAGGPPTQEGTTKPAQPVALRYQADHVELESAGLTLLVEDRPLDVGVALTADRVTLRGGSFPIQLGIDIGDGRVELEGELGLIPLVYRGSLHWKDVPVPLTVLAARPSLVPWIRSCRAQGEAEIAFRAEPGPGGEPAVLHVQGTGSVDDLELANPGDGEEVALGWKQLAIDLREAVVPLAPEPSGSEATRVALESVRLVEPRVLYTKPAPSLDALLSSGAASEENPAPARRAAAGQEDEAAWPFELSAGLVEVLDGGLQYVDRGVDYRGRVRDLDLSLEDVRWPGPRIASARLSARPPQGKAISLSGSLDGSSGSLELEVERLALPPLTAYSQLAGYRLSSGSVSLDTRLRANGTSVEADNHLELDQLGMQALDPGDFQQRFGMSLDLVLALLRDPAGRITLSVPVTVDRGATGVDLTTIVRSALRQAVVGAATSPLKVGGFALSALGVGGAEAEPLASVPGEATLADGQQERLAATAALMASRPGLGLELRGRSGAEDVPRLAEEILIARLDAGGELPEVEGLGFLTRRRIEQALRARGRGEPGELDEQDQKWLARCAAAVEVPTPRLAELARRRAEAARDALLEAGVDAARLDLGGPLPAGEPGVLLELHSLSPAPQ